jgi:hypothetical protein
MGVVGESVETTVYAGYIEVPERGFRKTHQMYAPRAGAPSSHILLGRSFLAHFMMIYDGPTGVVHFYSANRAPDWPVDDE